MPIGSTIIAAERLVLTRSSGVVTYEEVLAHQDGLLANPDFNPYYDQLGIHEDTEVISATAEQAEILGRRRLFSSTSFRAIAAGRDNVYGMFRMMGIYHDLGTKRESVGIFRDEESARQWLSRMRQQRSEQPDRVTPVRV